MRSSLFFDSIITDHSFFSPETLTAQWEKFGRHTEICFKVHSGNPQGAAEDHKKAKLWISA